jgi:hypothetical protein
MSTIMDIYFSPSLSDMRRRLEDAEEQMHQRQSESAKAADETQKAANEASAAKGKEYFKCKKLKTFEMMQLNVMLLNLIIVQRDVDNDGIAKL